MLQGPNKFKNYRLRWLSKPLRLVKFESLWIQVCSIMVVFRIPGDISLSFTTFFEFFDKVFSAILFWFTVVECPFTVGCFPFYSVILRFRGTTDSLPLLPWVPEPLLCQQLWWLVPSLFLIVFFFLCFFPQKPLAAFPFWGVPKRADL